ncbi:hypothetical protein [Blastopirellula retiformator]|uniref:Uncharacterized protein n=1 Tax=Blastopirellula retiformator TaxID=2527970 RepID=A0A5C5UZI7_9BACT|nr:hypothetical protein [Blastopirellula retiformator]TWT31786.1 hypothetical protein Enr8_37100 [Blastopirellula retiformator]
MRILVPVVVCVVAYVGFTLFRGLEGPRGDAAQFDAPKIAAENDIEAVVRSGLQAVDTISQTSQRTRELISLDPFPQDQNIAASRSDLAEVLGLMDRQLYQVRYAAEKILAGERSPELIQQYLGGMEKLQTLNQSYRAKMQYLQFLYAAKAEQAHDAWSDGGR